MDNMEGKAPPKKKVVKSRAKPKQQMEAVNILSEAPQEEAKPKAKPKAKPRAKPKAKAIKELTQDGEQEAPTPKPRPKRTPKPKTAVNPPEGEFIEKAKLKQLKDAERIYSKAIKSLTK